MGDKKGDDWAEEMILSVMRAGGGERGKSRPPWEVLADYVAELERRVCELERSAGLHDDTNQRRK